MVCELRKPVEKKGKQEYCVDQKAFEKCEYTFAEFCGRMGDGQEEGIEGVDLGCGLKRVGVQVGIKH